MGRWKNLMNKRERIEAAINLEEVDRIPTLGGWLTSAHHIQKLAGVTPDIFFGNPERYIARAYQVLDCDACVDFFVPKRQDQYRGSSDEDIKNTIEMQHRKYPDVEAAIRYIRNLPGRSEIQKGFDFEKELNSHVEWMQRMQGLLGDIVWLPARWDACAHFEWYGEFGYEVFLMLFAMNPEIVDDLFSYSETIAYLRNTVYAKAYELFGFSPIILLGCDICSTAGPLVSPEMLRQLYFPHALRSLEPLHSAGIKTIWHCDGNVMPIMEDILSLGVSGLQGFQKEAGVHFEDIIKLRTKDGKPLIYYGPLSVVAELPVLSSEEITKRVHEAIRLAKGNGSLLLFTSNTIGPDVPLENVKAMYKAPAGIGGTRFIGSRSFSAKLRGRNGRGVGGKF